MLSKQINDFIFIMQTEMNRVIDQTYLPRDLRHGDGDGVVDHVERDGRDSGELSEVFGWGRDEAFPGLQGGVLQSGVAAAEHDGTAGQCCRGSETPVQAHDHTFRQGVHQAPHLQAGWHRGTHIAGQKSSSPILLLCSSFHS